VKKKNSDVLMEKGYEECT